MAWLNLQHCRPRDEHDFADHEDQMPTHEVEPRIAQGLPGTSCAVGCPGQLSADLPPQDLSSGSTDTRKKKLKNKRFYANASSSSSGGSAQTGEVPRHGLCQPMLESIDRASETLDIHSRIESASAGELYQRHSWQGSLGESTCEDSCESQKSSRPASQLGCHEGYKERLLNLLRAIQQEDSRFRKMVNEPGADQEPLVSAEGKARNVLLARVAKRMHELRGELPGTSEWDSPGGRFDQVLTQLLKLQSTVQQDLPFEACGYPASAWSSQASPSNLSASECPVPGLAQSGLSEEEHEVVMNILSRCSASVQGKYAPLLISCIARRDKCDTDQLIGADTHRSVQRPTPSLSHAEESTLTLQQAPRIADALTRARSHLQPTKYEALD